MESATRDHAPPLPTVSQWHSATAAHATPTAFSVPALNPLSWPSDAPDAAQQIGFGLGAFFVSDSFVF
jgi:hypothetical protein